MSQTDSPRCNCRAVVDDHGYCTGCGALIVASGYYVDEPEAERQRDLEEAREKAREKAR